jgi:hypothetical protein
MMRRSKKPPGSGEQGYFNEKRPVNVQVDGGSPAITVVLSECSATGRLARNGDLRNSASAALPQTRLRYSILNAFIGEMDAARFAGMMAAKKEQIASATPATVSASGSHEETP